MHVDLPLDVPACARAVEELESIGFFRGAWMPAADGGRDVLRLHQIIDPWMDLGGIESATPFGKRSGTWRSRNTTG